MFQKNDYVVYKKNVCIIKDIKHNTINGKESYLLVPIDDSSLKIEIPTETANNHIRRIISKKDAEKIISKIPNISPFEITSAGKLGKHPSGGAYLSSCL